MNLEQPTFLEQATFWVALVAAVATIVYGEISRRQQRRQQEQAERQLELARQEALRHPKLELRNVSLVNAEEFDDVIRTREAKEKWREPLNRAMDEDMADTRGGFKPFGEASERIEKAAKSAQGYALAQILYDGPYPDLVLTFELRNMGRRVAKDVSGEVAVERIFLEPINFPLFNGEVFEGREFAPPPRNEAELKVGNVPPFPSEDNFMFRIALLRKSSGKTTIVITFSTPEGDHLEEPVEFEV